MPGNPALRAFAAGRGAAVGGAGRTGCWAPWRASEGGWAGTRLGPTPRPRRRWQGRGRVPRRGSGLGFRPRGARRGRVQSTVRPRLPAANHGPARPPPPCRVLCSSRPGGPQRAERPLRLLARADPVVCTRVCAGFPVALHTHVPAAGPGTPGAPGQSPRKALRRG